MKNNAELTSSRFPRGYAHGEAGSGKKGRVYTGQYYWGTITTRDNRQLTLAIVADGDGEVNQGQIAAKLAVDTIVNVCKESKGKSIPLMLGQAIGKANKRIFQEANKWLYRKKMSATVAIAAICDQRLYIANVGNCPIYLVRGEVLVQLTVDHIWAIDQIRSRNMSKIAALTHQWAGLLSRSVGREPKVRVDLGLYVKGRAEESTQVFNNQGFHLKPDDFVFVCSSGLTKLRNDGLGYYVEHDEIISTMSSNTPEQAAKMLISYAIGRNVIDDVTVVMVKI
jgi:PPM family protein phosphatase